MVAALAWLAEVDGLRIKRVQMEPIQQSAKMHGIKSAGNKNVGSEDQVLLRADGPKLAAAQLPVLSLDKYGLGKDDVEDIAHRINSIPFEVKRGNYVLAEKSEVLKELKADYS